MRIFVWLGQALVMTVLILWTILMSVVGFIVHLLPWMILGTILLAWLGGC